MRRSVDTTNPPWLQHAALPSDGTVEGGVEIQVFAGFVSPTRGEQQQQQALRCFVQRTLRDYVHYEAVVKVVGAWGCGVSPFKLPLQLEVVLPELPDGQQLDEKKCLRRLADALGLSGSFSAEVGAGGAALTLSRPSSPSPLALVTAGSSGRAFTLAVRRHLAQITGATELCRAVLAILGETHIMRDPESLTPDVLLVMCVAFLCSRGASEQQQPRGDILSLLRGFLHCYAEFDYTAKSITLPRPGSHDDPFQSKVHPDCQMSVTSCTNPEINMADGTRKLVFVTAMLKYLNLSIAKWDGSPSISRGKSLLFNIIAHKELWERFYQLHGLPQAERSVPAASASAGATAAAAGKPAPEASHDAELSSANDLTEA